MQEVNGPLSHETDFAGRTVLVTGSSRGIGRGIADYLLQSGASVVAHSSRDLEGLKKSFGGEKSGSVHFVKGDLSTTEGIREVAEATLSEVERLDGLVNNAGIYSGLSLAEESFENWDRVIGINLRSPFFLTKMLAEKLKHARGSVVNISSIMGVTASGGSYPYQASKSALISLTEALSIELAPEVRVNCVAPGFIATDINREDRKDSEFEEYIRKVTPLKRWGSVDDIVPTVCFLLSDGARFITGQTIVIDGGKRFV